MSKLYNLFKLGKSKIKPRIKPDKSKLEFLKSELNILKAKDKATKKMAKDIKDSSFLDYAKSKIQGKGSSYRVDILDEQYKKNYDKIFNKK